MNKSRYPAAHNRATKEEIKRKLSLIYEPFELEKEYDVEKGYDFFSMNETALKYSSNWFNPQTSSTGNSHRNKQSFALPISEQTCVEGQDRKQLFQKAANSRPTPCYVSVDGKKCRLVYVSVRRVNGHTSEKSTITRTLPTGTCQMVTNFSQSNKPKQVNRQNVMMTNITINGKRVESKPEHEEVNRSDLAPNTKSSIKANVDESIQKIEETIKAEPKAPCEVTVPKINIKSKDEVKPGQLLLLYPCRKCEKQCKSLKEYYMHYKTHKKPKCRVCSKRFRSQEKLKKHSESEHAMDLNKPKETDFKNLKTATSRFGRTRAVFNVANLLK